MNTLIAGLLTLSPSAPVAPAGDLLAARDEAGTKIERSFSIATESELLGMTQFQNGEEVGDMGGQVTRTSSSTATWSVVDAIGAVEDGRATAFTRAYVEVAGESAFEMSMDDAGGFGEAFDQSGDVAFESPLAEEVIEFRAGEDGLEPVLPEASELDPELLEGLEPDLSPSFLLPGKEVAEEESWEVDGAELARLLHLGGELHMTAEGPEEDVAMAPNPRGAGMGPDAAETEFDGVIALTHGGRREVEGRELIVIALQVDVKSTLEREPDTDEVMVVGPGDTLVPENMLLTTERAHTGEGELLFDPKAGLIVSLELSLEVEVNEQHEISIEIPGMGPIDIETEETTRETIELTYAASVE